MSMLIILSGAMILLAGIIIMIKTDIIFGYLRNNRDRLSLYITAVAARIVIGILLISQAKVSV